MNKQKIIDNVVIHYLDEMEQYLGDEIATFNTCFNTIPYERYIRERKSLEIEIQNFKDAISLLINPQKYWIDSLNSFIKYFKFYCSLDDEKIKSI